MAPVGLALQSAINRLEDRAAPARTPNLRGKPQLLPKLPVLQETPAELSRVSSNRSCASCMRTRYRNRRLLHSISTEKLAVGHERPYRGLPAGRSNTMILASWSRAFLN